jgi:hypothetical protein
MLVSEDEQCGDGGRQIGAGELTEEQGNDH